MGHLRPITRHQQMPEIVLPDQRDAERNLLGAVIAADCKTEDRRDVIAEIDGYALVGDFSDPTHRAVWKHMCERHRRGLSNNLVEFADAIRAEPSWGGRKVLSDELAEWTENGFSALAQHYAAQIRDAAERGRKIEGAYALLDALQNNRKPLIDWYAEAVRPIIDIKATVSVSRTLSAEVMEFMTGVDHLAETGRAMSPGLETGLTTSTDTSAGCETVTSSSSPADPARASRRWA